MVAGAALAAVVAVGGYFVYQTVMGSKDVAIPVPIQTPSTETVSETISGHASDPVAQVEPAAPPTIAPSFDVVRVEPDGSSVIAGNAAPDAKVSILLDGAEIGQATADAQGNFVALLTVPSGNEAQVLSLSSQPDGGDVVASTDSVILAPVVAAGPAPVVVAETEVSEPVAVEPTTESSVVPEVVERAAVETATVEPTPAAPTVLLANEQGVQVIQPSERSPEAMSNVVIDAISYDVLGEVQVSGRGAAQGAQSGFVRIYLNDAPIQTTPIGRDGDWHTALPNVDTGIYVLRIDQVDASGAVTSRTQTPFKRETAEVLANAQAANPTKQVSAITVQPGSTLWAIARDTYGDGTLYVRVFEANSDSIRNPDLIYPGQVFQVPE